MQLHDIISTLAILEVTGLESWKYADFQLEIQHNNPLALVGKINTTVIGFCIARLITPLSLISFISHSPNYNLPSPSFPKIKTTGNNEKSITECEIYNIGIKREFQNKGAGTYLLNQLISIANGYDAKSIWLEVRSSNKQAIRFYQKNDFKEIYERKDFYSKPLENAVVMKRNLQPQFYS